MSAPAGWYDAGTPGRLRWWDGAQWTEHECEAPARQPQPPQPPQQAPQPVPVIPAAPSIPAGWYPVPRTGETRWWDGAHWSAYSFANGRPRGNWYAVEPPGIAYVFGAIFLVLGFTQLMLATLSPSAMLSGLGPLALGAFWMSSAIALSIVRSRPAPVSAPVTAEVVQPLPGWAEGAGARWVALTPNLSRWWSGARWGEYVVESNRVRPTHGGAKAYRGMRYLAWGLVGLGAFGIVVGVLLLLIGAVPVWAGVALLVGGIAFALIGGIVFPVLYARRHALLLPEHPPAAV